MIYDLEKKKFCLSVEMQETKLAMIQGTQSGPPAILQNFLFLKHIWHILVLYTFWEIFTSCGIKRFFAQILGI